MRDDELQEGAHHAVREEFLECSFKIIILSSDLYIRLSLRLVNIGSLHFLLVESFLKLGYFIGVVSSEDNVGRSQF